MLTIKTHLKSLVTSSLYLSNVGTLVLRGILFRSRPPLLREEGDSVSSRHELGNSPVSAGFRVKNGISPPRGVRSIAAGLSPSGACGAQNV